MSIICHAKCAPREVTARLEVSSPLYAKKVSTLTRLLLFAQFVPWVITAPTMVLQLHTCLVVECGRNPMTYLVAASMELIVVPEQLTSLQCYRTLVLLVITVPPLRSNLGLVQLGGSLASQVKMS